MKSRFQNRHFARRAAKTALALVLALLFVSSLLSCGDTETPNGMKPETYLDSFEENIADYLLFVPEDWTVGMASGAVSAAAPSPATAAVSVTQYALSGTATLAGEWKELRAGLDTWCPDLKMQEEPDFQSDGEPFRIAGRDAASCRYTASLGGIPCAYRQFFFIKSGELYLLTCSAAPDEYARFEDLFFRIAKALTFDRESEAPEGMKAATHGETRFVHSEGYSFLVEGDWVTDVSTGVYSARLQGQSPTCFTVMTAVPEDASVSPQDYFESYIPEFEKSLPAFKIVSGPTEVPLSGSGGGTYMGIQYEYTAEVGGEADKYHFWQLLCKNGEEMYILTFSTPDGYAEDHQKYYDTILENFKINE